MKDLMVVMHPLRWSARFLLAGFALSLLIAACASSPEPAVTPSHPVTVAPPTHTPSPLPTPTGGPALEPAGSVEIWLSWAPQELAALQEVLDRYQREHPGVSLALAYYPPDELFEAFKQAAATRRAPTILLGPSVWGPDLNQAGWLLDVGALLDPELDQAMYDAAWSQATDGAALIGLPLEFQGMVIYRNRALEPVPAGTLGGWASRAQAFSEESPPGMIWDMGFRSAAAAIAACEGALIEPDGEPAFWGPEGVCWLNLLQDWAQGGRVVFNREDDLQAFRAGQIPWLIESTDQLPALRAALGEESLAIDPWPRYEATGVALKGFVWTENLYIAAGHRSQDLEAAWTLARLLLSPEVQSLLASPAGAAHLPVRADAELRDSHMEEAASIVRSGMPLPLHFDEARIGEALEVAAEDVLLRGAEPAFALALSKDRWEAAGGSGP